MFDGETFGKEMVAIVRDYVAAEVEPLRGENKALRERIEVLEARQLVVPEKGEPGSSGRDGVDGKDADPEAVKALVTVMLSETVPLAVRAAVDALPAPEKGEKGDPGDRGADGRDGDSGEAGRDGVGLADAMIDRSGELVLTMTDGRMKNLGAIIGRDGKDGAPGEPGRDGRDVEDILVSQDGAVIEFSFQVADTRSVFEIEIPAGPAGQDGADAYPGEAKGLFDPAAEYRALDVVSFNGSEWRAKHDNPGELPGNGWMLSACKGKRGDRGETGKPGRDGVSPVAQYLRGSELVTTLSDGGELKSDLSDLLADGTS